MTARSGLANLITQLRGMTEAGTADYTIAGAAYWGDDALQSALDRHRTDLVRSPLRAENEYVAGALEYHNYYARYDHLEEAASGTPHWAVEDSAGLAQGTADYTVNYDASVIRFTADTAGTAFYLTTHAFDLNAAAAEIWTRKAAHAASGYHFSADGATYSRQQVYDHCLQMAALYKGSAPMKVSRLVRSDARAATPKYAAENED